MSFEKKKIEAPETIGDILRRERESLGWSQPQAAAECGFDKKYIDLLEKNQYHLLPGGIYTRNFLRRYATILGFDEQNMMQRFREEERTLKLHKRVHVLPRTIDRDLAGKKLIITPVLLRTVVIVGAVILGLFYLAWQLYYTLTPPKLQVFEPAAQTVTHDLEVTLKGWTEPESILFINSQEILVDQNGYFHEVLPLQRGVNTIEVRSQKKHSRANIVRREILVEGGE